MKAQRERPEAADVRTWLQALAILLAVGWVYWPALRGGWLWDDGLEIAQNSLLHSSAGWWKVWLEPSGLDYYPLKDSLEWLQWRLWGDHPFGYHLTNVGLHLLGALLLWRLLSKLGLRPAWIGGLIFAVHPLAVESVAWISELKNTLSLPLLLLAMTCYVDFDASRASAAAQLQPPNPGSPQHRYFWSVGFFLAAMLCKTSVAMFPLVLLLYAWWRRGRVTRRDVWASVPFFAISFALGLVTVWFQRHRAIGSLAAPPGFFARLAEAGHAIGFYFARCVFPAGLLAIYPRGRLDHLSRGNFHPGSRSGVFSFGFGRNGRPGGATPCSDLAGF